MIRILGELSMTPMLVELERLLQPAWTLGERRPRKVFDAVISSRSLVCIAVLFQNLTAVKGESSLFTILEEAAPERYDYFTVKLSIPNGKTDRPDHTCWYSYPAKTDECVRSADFESFAKIDLCL